MNTTAFALFVSSFAPLAAIAQEPTPPAPSAAARPDAEGWTEGFGRGASYRAALAAAIEDAVAKKKGMAVARGPILRSRLSVVTTHKEDLPDGWFDGEAEQEREWVQQQIAGFVQRYEIVKKGKADDGQWEVTVRAEIATATGNEPAIVVDLADDDLRKWQLERFEEGASGAFERINGNYEAPRLAENLRASGFVRIVAKGQGVDVGSGAAAREREKAGQQLVASHRIVVIWQPMVFTSVVERPNKARPTSGPRPQYLTSGSVRAMLKIVDLVQGLEVYERPLTIALELQAATPVERLDALAVQLADQAKATVAEAIVFALRPPVVTRKWAGDGGAWFVEAAVTPRVLQGYHAFAVGQSGSLASPDWRTLSAATLVGRATASCTFQLIDVVDPGAIEVGVSEVRPVRQ